MKRLLTDTRGQALVETALLDLVLVLGLVVGLAILSEAVNEALASFAIPAANSIPGHGSYGSLPFEPVGPRGL